MLLFMPWCPINRVYDLGTLEMVPFERNNAFAGVDDANLKILNKLLAAYTSIQRDPVERLAVIRYKNRSVIDDLSDDEISVAYEIVSLATFAGLAGRDFLDPLATYCNADCFAMYVQKFENADFTALTTRKRAGTQIAVWSVDRISTTVPLHCHDIRQISLDENVLAALLTHRTNANVNEWGRWQSAISCFNQANTDSESVRPQTEWVLLCGAIQHLLRAGSKDKATAEALEAAITPDRGILVRDARRRLASWRETDKSLRYAWMKEFYGLRGDFAHGRLNPQRPAAWLPQEHLVLASMAFPLVAKKRLSNVGLYEFTRGDNLQCNAFESLADTDNFLAPPADQRGGMDTHWQRVRQEVLAEMRMAEGLQALDGITI